MKSLWMDDAGPERRYAPLRGNVDTDTAVVGGGMAGILCARLLRERGIDSVVVEAERIGMGITRCTTAKITAQHGLVYSGIARRYGLGAAREYWRANQEAVEEYRRLSRGFPCDFEEKTAYVYSRDDRKKLEQEREIYDRLGIGAVFQEHPPIPVQTVGALGMAEQAQFHPLKFLNAAAQGLQIYEDTFAAEIRPGRVVTAQGTVRARRVILATHFPMVNLRGLYFLKLRQHRSYVLALAGARDPGGMYIDEQEGGLSFRTCNGTLLLGGGGHPTGKRGGGWEELRRAAEAAYPGAREQYAWATQDCMSLDGIPYIGRHQKNSRELYVATGFNKWGMTGAMAAARVLSGLIAEGGSRYRELFDPSRSVVHPQLLVNLGQAAMGLLSFGRRCPHMGCALRWNPREHTWDCPCHGSRFDREGGLIDNPAKRGLRIE